MSSPLLEVEHLHIVAWKPGGRWAAIINDLSFAVRRGQVVALIGESGAGKTTAALAALGYARPGTAFKSGRILFDGINLLSLPQQECRRIRGRRITYVAQSAAAALNPAIAIGRQVAEPLIAHGLAVGPDANRRAVAWLARLGLPDPLALARRYPHEISGGQQQRVMIAMALASEPDLVVLDEPTTALDVTTQLGVLHAVKKVIREAGMAAIYVSHDLAVVSQVADFVVVVRDGEAVEMGDVATILTRPRATHTKALLRAVRPPPRPKAFPNATASPYPSPHQTPLISMHGISAGYSRGGWQDKTENERLVLRNVDLTIHSGVVVALVGESGSGKSTLARVIAGLLMPAKGRLELCGRPLPRSVRQRSLEERRRIQIVFQSPDLSLNPEHRVGEEIGRPLDLYFRLAPKARRKRILELLCLVGLGADYAGRYPAELSGGQKQRVAIARALAAEPDLILCDEVLSALDTIVAAQILELLNDLRSRLGVSYLFISHDLATVASVADRVLIMYAGQIFEAGSTNEVFSTPHHPYTSLLMASVPELRPGWLDDVTQARTHPMFEPLGKPLRDQGCSFRDRCPLRIQGVCDRDSPPLKEPTPGHTIRCHSDLSTLSFGL